MYLFMDLNIILKGKERGIIMPDQIKKVKEYFKLEGKDIDQLREVRNGVVKTLADVCDDRYNAGDVDNDRKSMDYMSAVTSVIDEMIWKLGGEV